MPVALVGVSVVWHIRADSLSALSLLIQIAVGTEQNQKQLNKRLSS